MLNLEGLHIRAALFRCIRDFFHQRGFLEVDTPIRQPVIIPESTIVPIMAQGQYLQTSPELCMKRLLAAGCEKIFQICPCFRKEEQGRLHLEEFTMLEWYRTNADYRQLMLDCEELVQYCVTSLQDSFPKMWSGDKQAAGIRRWTNPSQRLTVKEAFHRFAPISMDEALQQDRFDEVLVEYVEPQLGTVGPCFLMDYPSELASLAKLDPDNPQVAQRFELYLGGIELANGFTELTDGREQRQRFAEELRKIEVTEGRDQRMPERFLTDLDLLEDAAGIAFGLDRMLMLLLDCRHIGDVVTFSPDDYM